MDLSKSGIRSYTTTLKKFYKSMADHKEFPKENLREAMNIISEESEDLLRFFNEEKTSYWSSFFT